MKWFKKKNKEDNTDIICQFNDNQGECDLVNRLRIVQEGIIKARSENEPTQRMCDAYIRDIIGSIYSDNTKRGYLTDFRLVADGRAGLLLSDVNQAISDLERIKELLNKKQESLQKIDELKDEERSIKKKLGIN